MQFLTNRSKYGSEPLSTFEPRLREIFGRPAHDPRFVGKTT